jgi:hypothetical protein
MLQRASGLQIRRNAGRAKGVAAGGVGEAGGLSPALDHVQHIKPGHRTFTKPVALAHVAEERPFLAAANSRRCDPGVQVSLETGMAGHLVALAALFVQAEPPAFAMLKVVADLHRYRGADTGEAVDHGSDQRPIA